MRSFAIATLISAVAANTYTAYSTKVESVISCAPEVTDCPGSSTYYHPATETTTCTTDEAHPTGPAQTYETHPAVTTSAPVYYTTTSAAETHPVETHPAGATETGAVYPTTSEEKTWETYTKPSKPTHYATTPVAGGAKPSGSGKPYASGSGAAKPSGTGSVYPTAPAPYTPKSATGDASAVRAAGVLAGAGALLAFLL